VLTVILGVVAAAWLGAGFVIQQHVAATAPWSEVLSLRLLADLVRHPLWLAGIAAMVVGQLLGAVALGRGSLALVEPLLATSLLFALPLAAVWQRQHLGRREWLGAIALLAGLAGFLLAAAPGHPPLVHVPAQSWIITGGSVLALVAVMVWWAQRSSQMAAEGTLLGTAAGLMFGLQDALTNRVDHLVVRGIGGLLTSWQPYALLAVAIVGLTLDQSAFRAAPLTASLPGLTVAEPLAGIILGAALFADPLNISKGALAAEAACLLVVAGAVYVLSQSSLIVRKQSVSGCATARHPGV
jgi:drug/metabolite transporter (DMT)-like permease